MRMRILLAPSQVSLTLVLLAGVFPQPGHPQHHHPARVHRHQGHVRGLDEKNIINVIFKHIYCEFFLKADGNKITTEGTG